MFSCYKIGRHFCITTCFMLIGVSSNAADSYKMKDSLECDKYIVFKLDAHSGKRTLEREVLTVIMITESKSGNQETITCFNTQPNLIKTNPEDEKHMHGIEVIEQPKKPKKCQVVIDGGETHLVGDDSQDIWAARRGDGSLTGSGCPKKKKHNCTDPTPTHACETYYMSGEEWTYCWCQQ